jgi:hypothetical protein
MHHLGQLGRLCLAIIHVSDVSDDAMEFSSAEYSADHAAPSFDEAFDSAKFGGPS